MFKEYNANPNGDNIDDCVVRAISKVLDMDYWDVFDELCKEMDKRNADDINQASVFVPWLNDRGWECREVTDKITVNQFCKSIEKCADKKDFRALLLVNGHMTAVIGSDNYDTWNPTRFKINFVFVQKA